MSYVVQRPGSNRKNKRPGSAVSKSSKGSKGGKSVGGGSGFSGTTASSRYVFSEDLDSLQVDMQKKFTVKQGYATIKGHKP